MPLAMKGRPHPLLRARTGRRIKCIRKNCGPAYCQRTLSEEGEQRGHQLRTLSAVERYAQLLRDFPGLMQRVPLKYLASHLGSSPETLSCLRARRGA